MKIDPSRVRLSTLETIPGHRNHEHVGVAHATASFSLSFTRDFLAGLREWWGGRSRSHELQVGSELAGLYRQLQRQAAAKGADAVVGVRQSMSPYGPRVSLLCITLTGTMMRTRRDPAF